MQDAKSSHHALAKAPCAASWQSEHLKRKQTELYSLHRFTIFLDILAVGVERGL